jgi:hypothetical protein
VNIRIIAASSAIALAACAHQAQSGSTSDATTVDFDDGFRAAYFADDAASYKKAMESERAYLADHAADRAAREVRLHYAKLLFGLKDLDKAAEEMQRLAASGNDYLARVAARNVVVIRHSALKPPQADQAFISLKSFGGIEQAALNLEWESIVLPETPGLKHERPMPDAEHKLLAACDAYAERADPTDPALMTVILASAEINFRFDRALEGVKRCDELISRWPQADASGMCVRTTINALNRGERWADLESHVRGYQKNLSLIGADGEMERQLERVVQTAAFKRIQVGAETSARITNRDEERHGLLVGAMEFREFQKEFPYSPHADKALYNALVYFSRLDQVKDAISTAQLLLAQYGSSPLAREAKKALASLNARVGETASRTR